MKPVRYQIVEVSGKGFYVRFKRGPLFGWIRQRPRCGRGYLEYFPSIEKSREALDLLVKDHSPRKAKETVVYEERYGALEGLG